MLKKSILFLLLYGLAMFLSLNMNSKYEVQTYKSTMWADASGYYVYLPATFLYNWKADKMPAKMDSLTGGGFVFEGDKNKIFTKYTCGVSYFQTPFFALAHLHTLVSGGKADGFSKPYVNSILFAGVFYMLVGIFFLYSFLNKYYSNFISVLVCVSLVACTNLYYYGIEHTGLSHIYSFSLICFLLWLLWENPKYVWKVFIPSAICLVLIRPTNLVAVLILLAFFYAQHKRQIFKNLTVNNAVVGLVFGIIILLPQLFYWKYISNNWVVYSYKNEGFTNWMSPKFLEVFFAAENGFFTYAPLLFFAIMGFVFLPVNKKFTTLFLVLFLLISYLNASWWFWQFGCAYGARAFVEYYPFLSLGLAASFSFVYSYNKKVFYSFLVLILTMAAYNLLVIYNFDDCFYGSVWEYSEIATLIKKSF